MHLAGQPYAGHVAKGYGGAELSFTVKGSKYSFAVFHCNETGNIEYAGDWASIDDPPQNGDYGDVELLNNGSALGVYSTPVSYLTCAVNPTTCAFTCSVVLKHYQPG